MMFVTVLQIGDHVYQIIQRPLPPRLQCDATSERRLQTGLWRPS